MAEQKCPAAEAPKPNLKLGFLLLPIRSNREELGAILPLIGCGNSCRGLLNSANEFEQ